MWRSGIRRFCCTRTKAPTAGSSTNMLTPCPVAFDFGIQQCVFPQLIGRTDERRDSIFGVLVRMRLHGNPKRRTQFLKLLGGGSSVHAPAPTVGVVRGRDLGTVIRANLRQFGIGRLSTPVSSLRLTAQRGISLARQSPFAARNARSKVVE